MAGWLLMITMMVLFWGAIALAAYGVYRSTRRGSSSALDVLEQRFARGEIDAEEFAQRRDLLLQTKR